MRLRQYAYFVCTLLTIVVFVIDAKKCPTCPTYQPVKSSSSYKPIQSCPPPPVVYKTYKVSKNPPSITQPVVKPAPAPTPAPKPIITPEVPTTKSEAKPVETKTAEVKQETQQQTQQKKSSGTVYSIGSMQELNEYIEKHDKVIIDIYASWCGPCKSFAPIYEEFAQKHPDIICLKVDGEKVPAVKKKYNVTGYPTFVIYKNKQEVGRFSGASQSLARFEERVKVLL